MKKRKKIIAAGHICLDITPIFPEVNKQEFDEILTPGKLLNMNGVDVHTGGAAANTGLALKLLGADVKIIGKTGKDDLGWIVKRRLEESGVWTELILDEKAPTSYSIVLALPQKDRVFLHDPGANDTYQEKDILDSELDGADLFHFGYPPLMERMYQRQGAELEALFCRVKMRGLITSLDMASVDENSKAGKAQWEVILRRVLPWVDIFLPSIEEILFMADREKYRKIREKADGRDITEILNMEEDVRPIGEKLLEWGAKIVVLKCGAAGVCLMTAEREKLSSLEEVIDTASWAAKCIFEKSYKPAKIASGTGAGDTCIAAFLMAMLTGEDPEMSIKLAAAEGASCVEAYDALSGLKSLEELKEKIEKGWEKSTL